MQLDQGHLALVAQEDREHRRAQVLPHERARVRGYGRDRRWPAAAGDADAVNDVFGVDSWPHADAHLRQGGAHVGELHGKRSLLPVESFGVLQQHVDLGEVCPDLLGPARPRPVASGIANGGHEDSPERLTRRGKT